jgi:hypothetical protein
MSKPMIIEVTKAMSKADMQRVLASLPNTKKLDAWRFVGTVKWTEDPVAYQKRMRDEW